MSVHRVHIANGQRLCLISLHLFILEASMEDQLQSLPSFLTSETTRAPAILSLLKRSAFLSTSPIYNKGLMSHLSKITHAEVFREHIQMAW